MASKLASLLSAAIRRRLRNFLLSAAAVARAVVSAAISLGFGGCRLTSASVRRRGAALPRSSGIGVTLAPTIKANWSTVLASQFVESVAAELPKALTWPATAYRSMVDKPGAPEKPSAAE